MQEEVLIKAAINHLNELCSSITDRSVGSEGNRRATRYLRGELERNGWLVEETPLDVIGWETGGARLDAGGRSFDVFSGPYSKGCHLQAELVAASSLQEIENARLKGKMLLLHGEIAREQIMPKNFVFYNPEEHKQIISALEKSGVAAIICATGRNSALAGGAYPFPMFEDGDFDIPSVYMKDTTGEELLAFCGTKILLESKAERISSTAYNIVAGKKGSAKSRIVISAHIDAKKGTPGAIDNATGVTVLLLLGEMLKEYSGKYPIELAAFNGEDYYAVPGQMKYIQQNEGNLSDVLLNINIDGAGYCEGPSAFSLFDLPEEIRNAAKSVINDYPDLIEGLPWYQGDHSIFLQYGRPALAVSSAWFIENMETQDITHTPKDNLANVSYERVAGIVSSIISLIDKMNNISPGKEIG